MLFQELSNQYYTLSHLENDRDVSAYSGGRHLSLRARNLCVFSCVQKGTLGLTHKGCVLQRVSLGALSDVTVILGMRHSIGMFVLIWMLFTHWFQIQLWEEKDYNFDSTRLESINNYSLKCMKSSGCYLAVWDTQYTYFGFILCQQLSTKTKCLQYKIHLHTENLTNTTNIFIERPSLKFKGKI